MLFFVSLFFFCLYLLLVRIGNDIFNIIDYGNFNIIGNGTDPCVCACMCVCVYADVCGLICRLCLHAIDYLPWALEPINHSFQWGFSSSKKETVPSERQSEGHSLI